MRIATVAVGADVGELRSLTKMVRPTVAAQRNMGRSRGLLGKLASEAVARSASSEVISMGYIGEDCAVGAAGAGVALASNSAAGGGGGGSIVEAADFDGVGASFAGAREGDGAGVVGFGSGVGATLELPMRGLTRGVDAEDLFRKTKVVLNAREAAGCEAASLVARRPVCRSDAAL